MSVVPSGAIVDSDGVPTPAMTALLQDLVEATGGAWNIRLKRIDDTTVRIRMLGADKVWRSSDVTLA